MNMLTTLLSGAILAVIAYLWLAIKRHLNYWHSRGIACEPPHPLMGNLRGVMKKHSFQDIWLNYYNTFKGSGPFAGFYWFQVKAVFVLEPALAKCILIKDFNNFVNRGIFSNPEDDPLSGNLFSLEALKWRPMRNKLSPTFTSGKMKIMFPTIIKVGAEFERVFAESVKQNLILEVRELVARFTTDVIGTCAFGIECNSLKDPQAEFRIMGKKALTDQRHGVLVFAFMQSFPDLASKFHMKETPEHVEKFFMRIVRETVVERERLKIRRNDFMDMLIDLKNNKILKSANGEELTNLTMDEVAAQAFIFLLAGFETSSTTMSFVLYELAQHTDIQQRAREEILSVLDAHNSEFTYECIKELIYLNQIISETLRLYTVLPLLIRIALEDYVVPGHPKYVIKKGMRVLIPTGAMHRDAKYYPNPDVFDPDNFTPQRVKQRDGVEWLPFGEGPRNCVGMRFGLMQSCVGLALLLKNFKFSVCSQTQIPMVYDKEQFLVSALGGIYLKVEKV